MADLKAPIRAISQELRNLDPGELAKLRRMGNGNDGGAIFWRLLGILSQKNRQHGETSGDMKDLWSLIDAPTASRQIVSQWQRAIKIMAILSDKGRPENRREIHAEKPHLGAVFCDGGRSDWGEGDKDPRPFVSQQKLARFIATPPEQRGEALERIARSIANNRDSERGINCVDIASLLFDKPWALQDLAQNYYQRLDRANRSTTKKEAA